MSEAKQKREVIDLSQDTIYSFLKKHKRKKYLAEDLERELEINESSCMNSLRRLVKSNSINSELILVDYKRKKIINGKEEEFNITKFVRRYYVGVPTTPI